MNPPFALILSGPPGAGKTTLSSLVAEEYSLSTVFEADSLWNGVVCGLIDPWASEALDQNRVLVRTSLRAGACLSEGGYATVLSLHATPQSMCEMAREITDFVVPVHYIVLRPSLAACLDRCARREGDPRHQGALSDVEAIRHLYADYAELGGYERFVLDTSALSISESVALICEAMARGTFRIRAEEFS